MPPLSVPQIIDALAVPGRPVPRAALLAAIERGDAIADALLEALWRAAADPDGVGRGEKLHLYALYLLAHRRDARAFEPALAIARLPPGTVDRLLDTALTEGLGRILAAVGHGRSEPLKELIAREGTDEYVPMAMLTGLAAMVVAGDLRREDLVDYFAGLFAQGDLARRSSTVIGELVTISADLGLIELRPQLVRAFDEGLVDPLWVERDHALRILDESGGVMKRGGRDPYSLIDDPLGELEWLLGAEDVAAEGARAGPKIGRNDPCPCGSGEKFKKCCGRP
jgi:hypothetical protein